ncbi:MAG: nitroreductase [Pseudomonadota bacterium]|nr:nitroreductase [Gammaproteobacteria bacterium]MEE2683664.1 nitroreductase [Pseudomonadota bacterium]|tara:strand:- start:548 stop:1129 length:582 start_codon:yes stop_codon:yes gene_type:complete
MENSTINSLLSRRSVLAKNLCEPGPKDEELELILKAAIRVPDHGRIEPWRIQILHKNSQLKLGSIIGKIFKKNNPDASEKRIQVEIDKPSLAPLLLIITSYPDKTRFEKIPEIEQKLSSAAVCQNILIASYALNYGAQWLTGWATYSKEVKEALGHHKSIDIVGFIHIGTPDKLPNERKRPEFDSIISKWQDI